MVKIKQANIVIASLLAAVTISGVIASSCSNPPKTTGKEACIPVPPDTSALGKIDHFIALDQIDEFKKDFLPQRDSVSIKNPNLYIPVSEAFNKAALIDILKDPESVGIRIYYGLKKGDKRNEFRLILVGVNEQGKDLYISKSSSVTAAKINGANLGGAEFGQCSPPCH